MTTVPTVVDETEEPTAVDDMLERHTGVRPGDPYALPTVDGTPMGPEQPAGLESMDLAEGVTASGEAAAVESPSTARYQAWSENPGVNPFGSAGGAGGGGKFVGEIEMPIGPGVDPQLRAAQQAWQARSAQLEKLGYQARADSLALGVDIQRDFQGAFEQDFEKTSKQIGELLQEAEDQKDAIGELVESVRADRINPGQFFANVGDAGKFAAALAVAAGSMAQAFGGGPNVAYNIVQRAIDMNVRSQIANMRHRRSMIAHEMNFLHNIRGLAKDYDLYGNYLRLGLTTLAQSKWNMIKTGYSETMARLAAQDVENRFASAVIDAEIKAISASQAKAKVKIQSLAQASHAYAALQAVGKTAPRRGAPAAATGKPKGPPTTAAAPGAGAQAIVAFSADKEGRSEQEQAKEAATAFRYHSRGMNPAQRARLWEETRAALPPGVSQEFTRLPKSSLLPLADQDRVPIELGGFKAEALIDERMSEYYRKKPGELQKAISAVQRAEQNALAAERINDLLELTNIRSPHNIIRHLRRYGGDWLMLPPGDPRAAKALSEIDALIVNLQEEDRLSAKTKNAINTLPEMQRAGKLTSSDISWAEQVFDTFNDPEVRKARFEPEVERQRRKSRAIQNETGIRIVEP